MSRFRPNGARIAHIGTEDHERLITILQMLRATVDFLHTHNPTE